MAVAVLTSFNAVKRMESWLFFAIVSLFSWHCIASLRVMLLNILCLFRKTLQCLQYGLSKGRRRGSVEVHRLAPHGRSPCR